MKTRIIQNDPDATMVSEPELDPAAEPRRSTNLAGRMGRWSARHRKIAIFGWLAFVIAAFAVGVFVIGAKQADRAASGPGESGRVERLLEAGFAEPPGENVLVQSEALTVQDSAFRAAIEDVVAAVSGLADVQNVRSPLERENTGQISPDRRSALVEFQIRGTLEDSFDKIDAVVDRVAEVQREHPQLFIGQIGDASAEKQIEDSFTKDLAKAGLISIPITLIILVVAFGALVAAGIPLLLGLSAVVATIGLLALPSQLLPVDLAVNAMVLLIGLAVGVDYSLFYLKREREERAAGRSEEEALEAAAATSGRSVLISGLTVMVAMAGMFLAGDKTFAAFGMATILVVAVAMIGSLTVLPAVLSKLGDNVERIHVPFVGRLRRDDGEGRIWGAIIDRVLRRPVLSVVLAGGLLLALAAPALGLRTVLPGPETFPQSLPVLKTYNRLQQAFPGNETPAVVVVEVSNVNAPEVRAAIDRLTARALASGQMHEPITIDVNPENTIATIALPTYGEGNDEAATAAVRTLREDIVPETVGALPNAESGVTGNAAQSKDVADQMRSKLPLVFGFVLVFAFALMLVAFRSLVIAAKAILLNLLSVAAAYGILVLVFQHGWGKNLLGFSSTAGIDPVVPMLLFVILFGLSMDYHVFILSRIRELYDRGASTDEAIAHGIKTTAGVVTSAAIVMFFVFAVFAALSMLLFKQFGVGLAAAILIDATIVRAVLLPATMKLLGEANWYLPKWLEWLPHLEHGGPVDRIQSPPALGPTG